MRVSYEWLKSMVDVPADPQDLVAEFVRTGTEVEAVERMGAEFDHVVTGQVVSKEPHPDSDHMWLCKVDVGDKNLGPDGNPEPLQIVCGAQNFEQGDKIVVAMIGAVLPGGFKIKKSKLRGVESCGMNCSERELGLSDSHEGIIVLPKDAPLGMDFADYQGLSDTVIDCEMTPNRPDCLSMMGVAVEVSAILDEDTHIELPTIKKEEGPNAADLVDVAIEDPELCPRYTARVVRNVKIGPSPEWLAKRVRAAGARPINNVVDVTNYVMFLTGQPLHAFDLGKLSERDGKRHIVVRAAREGEMLTTLDGQERKLTTENLLITDDGETPVALAGVMGGLNSDIDDTTVDVLLESARFDPGHTSRTSRSLDLMSEASIRFERGVDVTGCDSVADIAAALFESCCGATVCPGMVDAYPAVIEPTLPAAKNHAGGLTPEQMRLRTIGQTLRACGLSETSTYCFADPRDLERLGMPDEGKGIPVKIIRPLVADQSEMRRDLLPGLLRAVAFNKDHGVANVHLYEIGRVLFGRANKSLPDEQTYVAGVLCGSGTTTLERQVPQARLLRCQGRRRAGARRSAPHQDPLQHRRPRGVRLAAAGPVRPRSSSQAPCSAGWATSTPRRSRTSASPSRSWPSSSPSTSS